MCDIFCWDASFTSMQQKQRDDEGPTPTPRKARRSSFPEPTAELTPPKASKHSSREKTTSSNADHKLSCKDRDCARCKYIRLAPRWKKKCRLMYGSTSIGSWIGDKRENNEWKGAGCIVCNQSGDSNAFARFEIASIGQLQLINFETHQQCKGHRQATAKFFGKPFAEEHDAPSTDAFRKVLRYRREGNPLRAGIVGVGHAKKLKKMQWCLAESLREIDAKHFRKALSVAVHMDGKGHRLGATYAILTSDLVLRRGVLGHTNLHKQGRGTIAIVNSMKQVLEDACTKHLGAPKRNDRHAHVEPVLDRALHKHLMDHLEVLDSDAASDETAAKRMLKSAGCFPNLKLIIKDPAHGATRILKRPYAADEYLAATMGRIVSERQSICQKIQNSTWFSDRFNDHISAMQENPASTTSARIRNLSAAKHRFQSLQEPVSRCILFMEALLMVVVEASALRSDRVEGVAAAEFLHWVDDERLVVFGMLGDAGDEAGQFIRFWDTTGYDTADIGVECARFVHHIDWLFVQGHCVNHGFTKYMLDFLSEPRVLPLRGGSTKRIGRAGGPSPEVVARALARLRCWVALAISVVNAEFPSWDILQAFSIFRLSVSTGSSASHSGTPSSQHERSLKVG